LDDRIKQEIGALKRERNAVVLAHLYTRPEVQELADIVGDSLDLSRKALEADADVIVFCGVRFMAETAKILNPGRTVLLPDPDAGCPMADMVTADDVRRLRKEYPDAAFMCYVNSSAEVKAACDICCTSTNAVAVAQSLKEERIVFVPDQNLGHYISRFVPQKQVILFPLRSWIRPISSAAPCRSSASPVNPRHRNSLSARNRACSTGCKNSIRKSAFIPCVPRPSAPT
jgi:quinolinate synthase